MIASAASEKDLSVVFYGPADELQAGDETKPHVERRNKTAHWL
jgi:hypothetical protein